MAIHPAARDTMRGWRIDDSKDRLLEHHRNCGGVAADGLTYLTGSEQVVSGFTRSGYPQHLRIVLGIAKPLAAYAIGEPAQIWSMPLALLVLLSVSYVTRPANRRVALAASW